MFNFVTFVLSLGFFSGFPKPDLISVDIGTFQIGGGIILHFPRENENHSLLPDLGLSVGQARAYWGKKLAFVAGLELLRGEVAYAPSNYTVIFGTTELLMPEIGLSVKLGPERLIDSKACLNPFMRQSFVPRLDFICGFSPFNPGLAEHFWYFAPTIRTEAKLVFSRSIQVLFENRNVWMPETIGNWYKVNTFNLALCFAFGGDYLIEEEDEPRQQTE